MFRAILFPDNENKSPLTLTDQHDAVPRANRAVHRCWRSVW